MAWHDPNCHAIEILWDDERLWCSRCGSKAPSPSDGGLLEALTPPPPVAHVSRSKLRCSWPQSVEFQELSAAQESQILEEIDSWEIGLYKKETPIIAESEHDIRHVCRVDEAAQTTRGLEDAEQQVQLLITRKFILSLKALISFKFSVSLVLRPSMILFTASW